MPNLRQKQVLRVLEGASPRALHLSELCEALDVAPSRKDRVLRLLDSLVRRGLAQEAPGMRFRAKQTRSSEGSKRTKRRESRKPTSVGRGRISMHPRGYGFVAAEDGRGDVFIPPDSTGGAMHGDLVEMVVGRSPKGREGRVVSVAQRSIHQLTGRLRKQGRQLQFEPDDLRVPSPLPILGSPQMDRSMVLVAEIARYPEHGDEVPEVRIVRELGLPGEVNTEVARVEISQGLREDFAPEVEQEAQELPSEVTASVAATREDLRGLELLTIDPEDARDHDDAVWAKTLQDGGFRVVIAIADVSHYVPPGSAMDAEALARGCSIYFPDRAVPMLPPGLSSHIASLKPGVDRLCMAVEVELSQRGEVVRHRYIEGVMRSRARLTYQSVAHALGLTEQPLESASEEARVAAEAGKYLPTLEALLKISQILRKRRRQRGALEFELPEARIKLDPETQEPVDIVRSREDPGVGRAYELIEDFMLLANEVVASDLSERSIPTIYRVHGPPDEEKVELFMSLAHALGFEVDPDVATHPKKLAKLLRKLHGSPRAQALHTLLLRAMQQAMYDTEPLGHFGLAAEHYLHFTSPIRRYPDLVVHRVLKRMLRGDSEPTAESLQALRTEAQESSRLERRALDVERAIVALYRAMLMRDHIGEVFEGTISGVAAHGFYTSFDRPFVEALTPLQLLVDDTFELDDLGLRLDGQRTGMKYEMGDRIKVRVEDVDLAKREVIASPLDAPDASQRPPSKGRRPDRQSRSRSRRSEAKGAKGERGRKTSKRSESRRSPSRRGGDNASSRSTGRSSRGGRKRRK